MSVYNIVSSGSHGNAVIYHGSILVDIGVSFKLIEPYVNDIQIVLITHEHFSDHLNFSALRKLQSLRPSIRIGCCEWMVKHLVEFKNVDVYEIGEWYNYGAFKLSPVKAYHDVLNCGFRIFKGEHKTFHVTDTSHLQGITAKNYDLYACEHNYNEETIHDSIAKIEASGGFAHQRGSINTHLSIQQAKQFIFDNRKESSEVIRLHESKSN